MKKIKLILNNWIGPIGMFDYGVFIVFLLVSMLFVLTIVRNF